MVLLLFWQWYYCWFFYWFLQPNTIMVLHLQNQQYCGAAYFKLAPSCSWMFTHNTIIVLVSTTQQQYSVEPCKPTTLSSWTFECLASHWCWILKFNTTMMPNFQIQHHYVDELWNPIPLWISICDLLNPLHNNRTWSINYKNNRHSYSSQDHLKVEALISSLSSSQFGTLWHAHKLSPIVRLEYCLIGLVIVYLIVVS